MPTAKTIVIGAGLAGLATGIALARRGWGVQLIDGRVGGPTVRWAVVPAGFGRGLPAACCRDESLPFDVVLPGEHRVETGARLTLVDLERLRTEWREEAEAAGVSMQTGWVDGALRGDGGVVGVRLGGGEQEARLTIDASGTGVLLGELAGAGLAGGGWPREQREAWAFARVCVRPDVAQTAWLGRAQLRLDLEGTGALAWRCVLRDGTAAWVAATAGRGTTRSAAREVLGRAMAPLRPRQEDVSTHWLPSRPPLSSVVANGLLVTGAAGAWNDALLGITLPSLRTAADAVAAAVDPVRDGAGAVPAVLHEVNTAPVPARRGVWAARVVCRHMLDELGPGGREGLVTAGVLGPGAWSEAVLGGSGLGVSSAMRLATGRLPGPWRRRSWEALVRVARLHAHAHTYPRRFDPFEMDRWQAGQRRLFRGG